MDEQNRVLSSIAAFALGMTKGLKNIEAERDENNKSSQRLEPSVMPKDLVSMRPKDFVDKVLKPRMEQLKANFGTDEDINRIEADQRDLWQASRNEPGMEAIINKHDSRTSFNDAWSEVSGEVGRRFYQLRRFCVGIATVFPNSSSVESDFSILKWELNESRTNLLDLSLEGIFQAKQFKLLDSIASALRE